MKNFITLSIAVIIIHMTSCNLLEDKNQLAIEVCQKSKVQFPTESIMGNLILKMYGLNSDATWLDFANTLAQKESNTKYNWSSEETDQDGVFIVSFADESGWGHRWEVTLDQQIVKHLNSNEYLTRKYGLSRMSGSEEFKITTIKTDTLLITEGSRREIIYECNGSVINNTDKTIVDAEIEGELKLIFEENLTSKSHRVSLIHDGRKSMFFNNMIIEKNKLIEAEQSQFLQNYFVVHKKYLEEFKYIGRIPNLKTIATTFLLKHYSRKVFLQLCQILFKYDFKLSAYIKFDNQQLIYELTKVNSLFSPTGFISPKPSLLQLINDYLSIPSIPNDIKNNFRIAKHIIENVTEIKRYFNSFYCLFPIELDKYDLNPAKLYQQQNPEQVKTLTDIDLLLVLFNESKFELYIIEGKDQDNGFEAAVRDDFNSRIIPNLTFPDSTSDIQIVNENGAKGGYVTIKN